jgi:proline dehydrogenase
MFKSKVYSILDYSVEGKQNESQFEFITNKTIDLIDFAVNNKSVPFSVFKPTAVGRFEIYRKVSQSEKLEDFELEEWNKIKKRFDRIFNHAKKNNIPVLVDAEESWIQTSVDDLLLDFMKKYNKKNPIIYNTLQAYRWDRYDYLVKLHEKAKNENFIIGIKLVRGAYMEKERAHANDKGYISPICKTKLETDKNFDNCLTFMMDNLDYFRLYIGTHNEKSTLHALKLLSLKGISNNNSKIWFGQLFGMSDHISFNLANSKYNVSKYLPFGPVRDVMPYLIRRAEENTSVAGQTNRELELIKSEMKRRSI